MAPQSTNAGSDFTSAVSVVCISTFMTRDFAPGVEATTYLLGSCFSHFRRWVQWDLWVFGRLDRISGATITGSLVWIGDTLGVSF